MNAQALWLTLPEAGLGRSEACGWPRFDSTVHLDWRQALDQLRTPAPNTETTWVVQCDAQEPGDLREVLLEVKDRLWVLVLCEAASGHSRIAEWLDAGADRCLPWPCEPELLAAMLRAMLRPVMPGATRVSHFDGLRFDHEAMTLYFDDQRIALTQREAEVMSLLIQKAGKRVANHEILMHMAKGTSCLLRPAAVQLYVHRINRKIASCGLRVDCIKRVGYGLRVQSTPKREQAEPAWTLPVVSAHRPFAHQAGLSQGSEGYR